MSHEQMMWRSVRAEETERHRRLPGDEFIPTPLAEVTHAVTILSDRQAVWPWLIQMGAGSRAGWYSYDFLDNGGLPSARQVIPELQGIAVGTIFPAVPGATGAFTVLAFEPERSLVLGWWGDCKPIVTWAFVLDAKSDGTTRLIVRARGAHGYRFHRLPSWLSKRVGRLVHFVMERKQLLEIARRVESSRSLQAAPAPLVAAERLAP